MVELAALQQRLGYTFRDESLLRLALTHPSIAHEQNNPTPHNQRLEFLGDSVLGVVLTRELYKKFPDADEGVLTKSRATNAPEYQLVSASGADHDRDFECAVLHDGAELARGGGGLFLPAWLA